MKSEEKFLNFIILCLFSYRRFYSFIFIFGTENVNKFSDLFINSPRIACHERTLNSNAHVKFKTMIYLNINNQIEMFLFVLLVFTTKMYCTISMVLFFKWRR